MIPEIGLVTVRCDGRDDEVDDRCRQSVPMHVPLGENGYLLKLHFMRLRPDWMVKQDGSTFCGRCAKRELKRMRALATEGTKNTEEGAK